MNNLVSEVSLYALKGLSKNPEEFEALLSDQRERLTPDSDLSRLWLPLENWQTLVTTALENDLITEKNFFDAGNACTTPHLLGPAAYLPMFLGSPALVFHNIDCMLATIDQCYQVNSTYVSQKCCLFEFSSEIDFEAERYYLEFLRGFFCSVASQWSCEIKNSSLLYRPNSRRRGIRLDWSIAELHSRRALEELLVEREFYSEMFEGLARISDTRSSQFADLFQKAETERHGADGQESSRFEDTTIYDGAITLDAQCRIASITQEALEMFGFSSEAEFTERYGSLHDLVPDTAAKLLLSDQNVDLNRTLVRADGSEQEFNLRLLTDIQPGDGTPHLLIVRDAGLAQKLNLSLEPTRQILDTLFTSNPSAIQIIDDAGWTMRINHQFEQLFDISADEVVGTGVYNILEDDRIRASGLKPVIEEAFMGLEQSSKTLAFNEGVYRDSPLLKNIKDTMVLEVTAFPLSKTSARPTSVVITYTDITEAFLTQQQLAQTEKLRSIGTLTSGIAHDFNNILGAIVPNADFIMSISQEDDLVHRKAKTIKSASKRASELMKQLMTYARQSKMSRSSIALNSSVSEALELIRNAVPRSISLGMESEADGRVKVMADPLQLQQVLINLIINAADAQPDGGDITVRTGRHRVRQRISFGGSIISAGDYGVVAVEDKGSGMPEEVRERIFDPFFTTKDKGRGTGLGLSVVHGIVKNHQGFIDVQSREKEGTVVSVYFPLAEKEGGPK